MHPHACAYTVTVGRSVGKDDLPSLGYSGSSLGDEEKFFKMAFKTIERDAKIEEKEAKKRAREKESEEEESEEEEAERGEQKKAEEGAEEKKKKKEEEGAASSKARKAATSTKPTATRPTEQEAPVRSTRRSGPAL